LDTTKLAPDILPGTEDQRVFIGGQYDFMPTLREIAQFVREISSPDKELIPIIAYDWEMAEQETMKKDLEILGRCHYAIFDLSDLGAQLVEMQEAVQKRIESLIVYPVRERRMEPERGRRTVLSFGLPHCGYRTFHELKGIVWRFLTEAPWIPEYIPRIIYDPGLDREIRRIRVLLATHEEDKAKEILDDLVAEGPYRNAIELWLQHAVVGHYRDDDRLTTNALNKAAAIARGNPPAEAEVAYCKGRIDLLKGKRGDAKNHLEEADRLNPGVGRFLELLGYVNWLHGDRKAAIDNTKKALDDESIPDPLVTIAAVNNLAYFYCEEARETGDVKLIYKAYELSTYLPAYDHVFRRKVPAWLETRGFAAYLMAKHLAGQPHRKDKAEEVLRHARAVLHEAIKRAPDNDHAKEHWRDVLDLEKQLRTLAITE